MTPRTKIALKLTVTTALIVVLFAWPVLAHYLAKARLEGYQARLRATGEKITVAELVPRLSADDMNAAMVLMGNAGRLPSFTSNQPPLMKYISPGKAQVGWQQKILPNQEVSNVWVELRPALEANADTLANMRAILQNNAPAFNLNYEQGFSLLLPHLARLKTIAQWFSVNAVYELHNIVADDVRSRSPVADDVRSRSITNALENLNALAALGGKTDREPLLISELVRLAINAIGMATAWEILQSPDLQEAELLDMQRTWQNIDFLSQAESALSMERAMATKTFAAGRKSFSVIAQGGFSSTPSTTALAELTQLSKDVLENPKEGLMNMARRYPGYWRWKWWQSYDDEIANIETVQASLEAIRQAKKGLALGLVVKDLENKTASIHERHPRSGLWLGYSLSNGTISFIGRISRIEMQRTLLVTAIAVKRYQLSHGTFPQQLNDLIPQFLASMPIDPMDGQPLRYHLGTNGLFLLYSVGDDRVDNGGDGTPIGTMAKQWLRGRDVVWPQAATRSEVQVEVLRLETEAKKKETMSQATQEFRKRYGLDSGPTAATGSTNSPAK